MATEEVRYITYLQAVLIHFDTMDFFKEIRYGVYLRELIESALARPQNAAAYENADIIRQAATLCFGLIKNHPWYGGNKRTATAITEAFLGLNGYRVNAVLGEVALLAYAIDDNSFDLDEIEAWYRQRSTPIR